MEYGYLKASQELDRIMAKYGSSSSSYTTNYGSTSNIDTISNNNIINKNHYNNHNNSISRISFNDNSLSSSINIKRHGDYTSNNINSTTTKTINMKKSASIPVDTLQSQLGVGTTAVTNIVAAFRELQTKLKIIEEERANAFRDKEETKRQLENLRKEFAIKQSTLEINTTEQLLNTSASSEQLRTHLGEVQAQESSLHHIHGSLQRTIKAHKSILQGLEEDISELNPKMWSLEERNKILTDELRNVESRISQLEVQPLQKSHSDLVELAAVKSEVLATESHISELYNATRRTNIRISALEKYANLMTTVNGDLCNTILARERTKERVIEFASLYTPPRYSWPKQLPYTEILSVINDAADNSPHHSASVTSSRSTRKDCLPRRVVRSKSPSKYKVMSPQEGALIAATTMAAITAQSSCFLPSSSKPSNKQYNIKGNISQANRSNKSFNSHLASRVLSLAVNNDGQLFDNLSSNDIKNLNQFIDKKKNKSKKTAKSKK